VATKAINCPNCKRVLFVYDDEKNECCDYCGHDIDNVQRLITIENSFYCSYSEKLVKIIESGTSMSGLRVSLQYLTRCEFNNKRILTDEACVSQISGKQYYCKEQMISSISGLTGHQSEFVNCSITKKPITKSEAGTSISGRLASLRYLTRCEFNNKPILTNEARISQISGKQYYFKEQKISSISLLRGHKSEFVYSSKPQFKLSCCVKEAIQCQWSNELFYPDDTRKCPITKLCFSKHFLNSENVFEIMDYVFDKTNKCSDDFELLKNIENMVRIHYKHHIKIINALLSPNHDKMYIYAQKSILFGLFTREIGFLYSINDHKIIGKIVKRRN
jgi:nitrogen fixation protein FixH